MKLDLIGIGTGNPDHLTGEAISRLQQADLVMLPRKGADKDDLADLRRDICARYLPETARIAEFDMPVRDATGDYRTGVDDWHDAIARVWAETLAAHLPDGGRAALLVWGDPALYDSTLRIAGRLKAAGQEIVVSVVPGITAIQVLAAAHAIPLNTVGAPFLVTTGRRLRDQRWPDCTDTLVVMLDGDCAFQGIDPAGVMIWWGAFLGMAEQVLDHGPLAEAAPRIVATRTTERARHGWIMDTYILRREPKQ
ncbi:MAG: precorrin-6A synthase (deacetylating) [Paracoccaceae bacterium]